MDVAERGKLNEITFGQYSKPWSINVLAIIRPPLPLLATDLGDPGVMGHHMLPPV